MAEPCPYDVGPGCPCSPCVCRMRAANAAPKPPLGVWKNGELIKSGFTSEYDARSWAHRWLKSDYEVRQ